jgi:hypothetical protein
MYSDELVEHAVSIAASLRERGATVSVTVRESVRAIDLALLDLSQPVVVRCVERATAEDANVLATMLAQGDFTRAAIVYTAEDQPHLSGEIEAYPISRIDELAALLAKESQAP